MAGGEVFDVILIGGGVVGCATAFHLTNMGYSCALLEKNDHLLSEASSGNSGMLHTGFDAPLGSLELTCIKLCQQRIYHALDKLGVPYTRLGATMVAWDNIQGQKLLEIQRKSEDKHIPDIYNITPSELCQMEPNLRRHAHSALWIPGETVVDPWHVPVALLHHARRKGAQVWTNCKVLSCNRESYGFWTVTTNQSTFKCKAVINCAGLHGDEVDELAGKHNFHIRPRKGQYIVYNSHKGSLINSSILPVPTDKTKGVIAFKSVYNNLIIGPTAEDVEERSIPAPDPLIKDRLLHHAHNTLPKLVGCDVIGEYTGVRPATQFKDYQIISDPTRHWITVGGIRSTGLSGCLGIADHVGHLVQEDLQQEPTQGRSHRINRVELAFLPEQQTATADGCTYYMTHPITQLGTHAASML
ncbi:glycerol 3-phosphate dehydrogenase-like [Haliotis rufescens]|uniref:glycerol 3-phosphate dehydrogenase-like n=1 Tax=Haliotis rufescens TaxID=6454 RepID=UPI00201F17C3|nr:glycerol 3-phosphate dehydrogenase-like [Haliotis rufescens]